MCQNKIVLKILVVFQTVMWIAKLSSSCLVCMKIDRNVNHNQITDNQLERNMVKVHSFASLGDIIERLLM